MAQFFSAVFLKTGSLLEYRFHFSEDAELEQLTNDDIENKLTAQNENYFFNDIGNERIINWSAFGICWTVRTRAGQECWFSALEIAAILQICQVEFANQDLLIIPSEAIINVELGDISNYHLELQDDNNSSTWKIIMPRERNAWSIGTASTNAAAIAITIMRYSSALPQAEFMSIVEELFKQGLTNRLLSVRPARELMSFSQPEKLNYNSLTPLPKPEYKTQKPTEPSELRWVTAPGLGYSKAKAEEFLKNRYNKLFPAIKLTLPRLLDDKNCREKIRKMKREGLPDWQVMAVIANIVCQWQTEKKANKWLKHQELIDKMKERVFRQEDENDLSFDLSALTDERIEAQQSILVGAAFQTWGLEFHAKTPNLKAMKFLLDKRYGHSSDDTPHPDPFDDIENKN